VDLECRVERADRDLVEHLHRGGPTPLAMIALGARAPLSMSAKIATNVADVLGEGEEAQPDLRDDAERSLTPHDERDAVVARNVGDRAAETRYFSVGRTSSRPST